MAIPVHQKYLLTISEASEYFSIGVRRLREFAGAHPDLVIFHGNKYPYLSRKDGRVYCIASARRKRKRIVIKKPLMGRGTMSVI